MRAILQIKKLRDSYMTEKFLNPRRLPKQMPINSMPEKSVAGKLKGLWIIYFLRVLNEKKIRLCW